MRYTDLEFSKHDWTTRLNNGHHSLIQQALEARAASEYQYKRELVSIW